MLFNCKTWINQLNCTKLKFKAHIYKTKLFRNFIKLSNSLSNYKCCFCIATERHRSINLYQPLKSSSVQELIVSFILFIRLLRRVNDTNNLKLVFKCNKFECWDLNGVLLQVFKTKLSLNTNFLYFLYLYKTR